MVRVFGFEGLEREGLRSFPPTASMLRLHWVLHFVARVVST